MPPPPVQTVGVQSIGSVDSVPAPSLTVTGGNTLIVCGVTASADQPVGSVTDDKGNSYTRAGIVQRGTSERVTVFYAHNAAAGATVVTLNCTGSNVQSVSVTEASGITGSTPQFNSATFATATAAPVTGNVTPVNPCLLVGCFSHGGSLTTITPGGTFTQGFEDEDAVDMPINTEWKTAAAGTYAADWSLGATRQCACVVASFEEAPSAGVGYHAPRRQGKTRYFGRRPSRTGL